MLSYELRDGQTNGDLRESGVTDAEMFGLLVLMMATGVPSLEGRLNKDLFMERVTQWHVVTSVGKSWPEIFETVERIAHLVEIVDGLKTNISKKTKTQFKSVLFRVTEERSADITRYLKAENN